MRANAETCEHPVTRRETIVEGARRLVGFTRCKRCGEPVDEGRERTMRISPRVVIEIDDCVAITEQQGWPSYGRFKYAETQRSGRLVAGILTNEGWRFVTADRLSRTSEKRCAKPSKS